MNVQYMGSAFRVACIIVYRVHGHRVPIAMTEPGVPRTSLYLLSTSSIRAFSGVIAAWGVSTAPARLVLQ